MRLPALALVAVLAAPLAAGARPTVTTATVIDRTFSCATTPDPVRKIEVSGVSGFRDPENPLRWKWPAGTRVESRFLTLAAVAAGVLPDVRWRALEIDADRCKASAEHVRLSASGLNGGPASQLQGSDAYECVVSSRVLVRIRAVFRSRATLGVQNRFGRRLLTTTAAAAQEGRLAVRTHAGKPLAYASVSETGKARLYTAPGCVSD